jgi:hypothetical protein
LVLEKLKSRIDEVPAELIKTGGRNIHGEIHKLIISIWNKEDLLEKWKQSIIVSIYKKGVNTDCINYRGISLLRTTFSSSSNVLLSGLAPYAGEIIGDQHCAFRQTDKPSIIYSAFVRYLRKIGEYNEAVYQLLVDFTKAYDSVRREVSYNIVNGFGIHMEVVRLI